MNDCDRLAGYQESFDRLATAHAKASREGRTRLLDALMRRLVFVDRMIAALTLGAHRDARLDYEDWIDWTVKEERRAG